MNENSTLAKKPLETINRLSRSDGKAIEVIWDSASCLKTEKINHLTITGYPIIYHPPCDDVVMHCYAATDVPLKNNNHQVIITYYLITYRT